MSGTRKRGWVFTLNNYREHEVERFNEKLADKKVVRYAVYGFEICPKTGTPHLQGCMEMVHPKSLACMKREYAHRAHWEIREKPLQVAADYCKKDGDFREFGELPQGQGHRTDLDDMAKEIANGKLVSEIAEDIDRGGPMLYHQYGRTMNFLEDLRLRKQFRTKMTKGIWIWGPTGVGKSHKYLHDFNPVTHYHYPDDNGWWDGYVQQETVIISDFRGEIPYGQMLKLIDKWPYAVRRRNREPMPFMSSLVVISSSLPPEKVYRKRDAEDDLKQLLRRFEILHITERQNSNSFIQDKHIKMLSSSSSSEEPERPIIEFVADVVDEYIDDYDYGDITDEIENFDREIDARPDNIYIDQDVNDVADLVNNP